MNEKEYIHTPEFETGCSVSSYRRHIFWRGGRRSFQLVLRHCNQALHSTHAHSTDGHRTVIGRWGKGDSQDGIAENREKARTTLSINRPEIKFKKQVETLKGPMANNSLYWMWCFWHCSPDLIRVTNYAVMGFAVLSLIPRLFP